MRKRKRKSIPLALWQPFCVARTQKISERRVYLPLSDLHLATSTMQQIMRGVQLPLSWVTVRTHLPHFSG